MYEPNQWYWVRLEHGGEDLPGKYTFITSTSNVNVYGWLVGEKWYLTSEIDQVISKIPTASHYKQMLTVLRQFGAYGETLWDETNFKNGYKKIPSGLLVRTRKLLNIMGQKPEPEEYFPDL